MTSLHPRKRRKLLLHVSSSSTDSLLGPLTTEEPSCRDCSDTSASPSKYVTSPSTLYAAVYTPQWEVRVSDKLGPVCFKRWHCCLFPIIENMLKFEFSPYINTACPHTSISLFIYLFRGGGVSFKSTHIWAEHELWAYFSINSSLRSLNSSVRFVKMLKKTWWLHLFVITSCGMWICSMYLLNYALNLNSILLLLNSVLQ